MCLHVKCIQMYLCTVKSIVNRTSQISVPEDKELSSDNEEIMSYLTCLSGW